MPIATQNLYGTRRAWATTESYTAQQWQPTTTSHDPNPPITLQNATAAVVTGAAALSGTGSLTGAASVRVIAIATASGTGSLNGAASVRVIAATALAGAGTLSASGKAIVYGAASTVGTGSLAAQGSIAGETTPTPSGTGVRWILVAPPKPAVAPVVAGRASLSARVVVRCRVTIIRAAQGRIVESVGRMTARGSVIVRAAGILQASGLMEAYARVTTLAAGRISGAGQLVAVEAWAFDPEWFADEEEELDMMLAGVI